MVMFPQLDETQRLQYLQALGVSSWLPTQALPGSRRNNLLWQHEAPATATEPVAGLQPQAAVVQEPVVQAQIERVTPEAETSPVDAHAQAEAVAQALGSLQSSPNEVLAAMIPSQLEEAPPLAANAATASTAQSKGNELNIAPMHLGLSWYANGVLVINDVPVQEGATMSSPIQRLQTAIVNALDDSSTQAMPRASAEFNWPLVPGPHGDHSLAGATSGLMYSLTKLLQDKACRQVLVMGPAPMQLLQPQLQLGETTHMDIALASVPMVYSHSLHQLLAVPGLKAETWAHLQPMLATSQA